MAAPAVKGYMPLCVTPRSTVCNEQGVGQWPMWKRYDSVKGIVDQYIDEPYRNFLALPYHEIDKLKSEELFYWYTPRCDTAYCRMSKTGDDHDYYKGLLEKTLDHYNSTIEKLRRQGKTEEASFLKTSLTYAGESEEYVYCGDGRVVVALWGMRPRQGHDMGESKLFTELVPEVEMHTVRYELGNLGSTQSTTILKKSHGTMIHPHQVPRVTAKEGYSFVGWDTNPLVTEVTRDLLFTAQYQEKPKQEEVIHSETITHETPFHDTSKKVQHQVRFFAPDGTVIKKIDVNHGEIILPGMIPQLPMDGNVQCDKWDGEPLKDVVNENRDYHALSPAASPKQQHTVQFLKPNRDFLVQTQVEHGHRLSPEQVPPLPIINGKACVAWDANPLGEAINGDRVFVAQLPDANVENGDKHIVRFLAPKGTEVYRIQVVHGCRLTSDQIPALPIVDGKPCRKWTPNPLKTKIKSDMDFVASAGHSWHCAWTWGGGNGKGFWRWILRIILLLLLVLLVLYIMYQNNPCSN